MRHAFGKPSGRVARVEIGQVIMSVRCKDQHANVAIEALRRAKFKFPGRQKVSHDLPLPAQTLMCLLFVGTFIKGLIWIWYWIDDGITGVEVEQVGFHQVGP